MGKNKRSKAYYIQSSKRQKKGAALGPDMVGFLCTCNAYERECVNEAKNVLTEFADVLYGKELTGNEVDQGETEKEEIGDGIQKTEDQESKETNTSKELDPVSAVSDSDEEPLDIEAAIKADVSVLKKNNEEEQKRVQRFRQVHCGAKNIVFIQTTLDDPLPLSLAIMDDILSSQRQWTKKLLRMLPVHATCKAYPEDIEKAVKNVASTYFKETSNTFCVVVKIRNNDTIKKETIIFNLVQIIQNANPKNTPELEIPEVVVNVDIVRKMCCVSILPHYFTKYSKYNLVILANKNKAFSNEDNSGKTEKSTIESKDIVDKAEKDTMESQDIDNAEKDTLESKDIVDKAETDTMESKDIDKAEKDTMKSKDIVDKAETDTMESKDIVDKVEKGSTNQKKNVDKVDKDTVDSKENDDKAHNGTLTKETEIEEDANNIK